MSKSGRLFIGLRSSLFGIPTNEKFMNYSVYIIYIKPIFTIQ